MRSPRILVPVLALLLAVTAALTASSPTAAAPAAGASGASHASHTSQRVAADEIAITSRIIRKRLKPNRPKQLLLVGTVEPRKGPVWIQRATKCSRKTRTCNFTFYAKRYLHQGRYQIVIDAPPRQRSWLWRAKVKESYSPEWQTCTKKPDQNCRIPY